MNLSQQVRPFLIFSLGVAIGCLIAPRLHPGFLMILGPLFLWMLILCVGLFRYQKQGLWLLIGAPFAFFNVVQVAIWLWKCTYHPTIGACP